jgi:hypothetical protein
MAALAEMAEPVVEVVESARTFGYVGVSTRS